MERCDSHIERLQQAVLSPGSSHDSTAPYYTTVASPTPDVASPGLEAKISTLQREKQQLADTLRRQRERQRRELADLEATVDILEEGGAFLEKELIRVEKDIDTKQKNATARQEANSRLVQLVEGLHRKQSNLEDEVRRLMAGGGGGGGGGGAPDSAVVRSGIEWTRQSDELLRQHQRGRGGAAALRSMTPEAAFTGGPPSPARLLDRLSQPLPALSHKVRQHKMYLMEQIGKEHESEDDAASLSTRPPDIDGDDETNEDLTHPAEYEVPSPHSVPGLSLPGTPYGHAQPFSTTFTPQSEPYHGAPPMGYPMGGGGSGGGFSELPVATQPSVGVGVGGGIGGYPVPMKEPLSAPFGLSSLSPQVPLASPTPVRVVARGIGGGVEGGGAYSDGGGGSVPRKVTLPQPPQQSVQQMMRQAMVQARTTSPTRPQRPGVSPTRPKKIS